MCTRQLTVEIERSVENNRHAGQRVEFLGQPMRITNPRAGFTGTRGLIVSQLAVQGFDQPDAVTQGGVERVDRLPAEIREVVQTGRPVAFPVDVTVLTALTRGLEKALVRAVSCLDDSKQKQSWVGERLDQFPPHGRLPTRFRECHPPRVSNLETRAVPVYRDFHLISLGLLL